MKNMLLGALAVIAMFTFANVYAEAPSGWAYEVVNEAIEMGLVPESLQSDFTAAATRAEFAALAVALYESRKGEIEGRAFFEDTDCVAVAKAAYVGLVNGVGNDMFNPAGTLTREQAAVLISRLAYALGYGLPAAASAFADNASIADWALESAGQVQAAEIMGGVGENRFDPHGSFTREQSIVTMMRLYDFIEAGVPQPVIETLVGSWYWNINRGWKYHFFEDRTGVFIAPHLFVRFDWTLVGNLLVMTDNTNYTRTWRYTITGSVLLLENAFEDMAYFFVRSDAHRKINRALVGVWYWNHGPSWTYTFNADGTGYFGFIDQLTKFEWTACDDMLLLFIDDRIEIIYYSISGTSLRLENPEQQTVFFYTRGRFVSTFGQLDSALVGAWQSDSDLWFSMRFYDDGTFISGSPHAWLKGEWMTYNNVLIQTVGDIVNIWHFRYVALGSFLRLENMLDDSAFLFNYGAPEFLRDDFLGTWYWNDDNEWTILFRDDDTGVRGWPGAMTEFVWVAIDDHLAIWQYYHGHLYLSDVWLFTVTDDSLRLQNMYYAPEIYYYTRSR